MMTAFTAATPPDPRATRAQFTHLRDGTFAIGRPRWTGDPIAAMSSRILIVDDHASFRRTARQLLEARRYIVAGEAASSAEAIEIVVDVSPDGVLLDVCLGSDNGFAVCAELTLARPRLSVVLVSASDCGEYTELMRASGARGFVLKSQLATTDLSRFWPR
jgi:DNA-binding NarL/FixJ family response regulator